MPSWRDRAGLETQRDLDALLDAALSSAEQALGERGAFSPFAVVMNLDGVISLAGATMPDDHPDDDDVVATLLGGLRDERDGLRAAGVVSDRVLDGSDQVAVELEHREGTALLVTLGYRLQDGVFTAGALQAGLGRSRTW